MEKLSATKYPNLSHVFLYQQQNNTQNQIKHPDYSIRRGILDSKLTLVGLLTSTVHHFIIINIQRIDT